jgi:hypothetical protein
MNELFHLSPAERAKRYRDFAADAARLAGASTGRATRQSYALIAAHWCKRADAIEKNILRYGMLYARSGIAFPMKTSSSAMALT